MEKIALYKVAVAGLVTADTTCFGGIVLDVKKNQAEKWVRGGGGVLNTWIPWVLSCSGFSHRLPKSWQHHPAIGLPRSSHHVTLKKISLGEKRQVAGAG